MAGKDGMQRAIPFAGEFYRHFKGNLYQVIGTAYDATTMEPLVVCQALYGNYRWYVRTVAEFLSPVDTGKYPDAKAAYRFTRVEIDGAIKPPMPALPGQDTGVYEINSKHPDTSKAQEEKKPEQCWDNPEKDQVRPELLRFLDAEKPAEKLTVLREIRGRMDEELITGIELSIDLTPDEREPLERRLELVEKTLEKRVRYEGGRLR